MDVIDLGAGDNDTPPPADRGERDDRGARPTRRYSKYGFQQGLPAFRQAASRWVERRFGKRFDPVTEILPLIGSKDGSGASAVRGRESGRRHHRSRAGLPGLSRRLAARGGRAVHRPAAAGDRLPAGAGAGAGGRAPAGSSSRSSTTPTTRRPRWRTPEYLERTVAVCRRHGILLAYDNAYCDLTFDGYRAPSIFEIPGAGRSRSSSSRSPRASR